MSDQETKMQKPTLSPEHQENENDLIFESYTINHHLTMLQPTTNHHPTTITTTDPPPVPSSHDHCPKKRRSPSTSSSSFQQPIFKKPTLLPTSSSTTTTTTNPYQLQGFSRLPLPTRNPVLRRSVSDKINYTGTNSTNAMVPSTTELVDRETIMQSLHRSASDPTTLQAYDVTTDTPPRPPMARRRLLKSPSSGEMGLDCVGQEITNAKRLKKMKDRVREMSQWCEHVMREGEEEKGLSSEDGNSNTPKDETCTETEEEAIIQEAVWVERDGKCLILNFRCPCGEGYKILLFENNCFYKLM